MRVVRISTTAFEEEDFFLMTTLSDDQIKDCLKPFLSDKKPENNDYDNEDLFRLLTYTYPNDKIEMHIEFDELNF